MVLSPKIGKSLSAKLILAIGFLIIIGGGISWYTLIDSGKKHLMNSAIAYTASYSGLVKKSVHFDMLTFNREAITEALESLGAAENIRRIRIFDSQGKISYSSEENDVGNQVDMSYPACAGCHSGAARPSVALSPATQWTTSADSGRGRMLTFVDPIYNEPSCSTAQCHAHPPERKVLGILETEFSLSFVDNAVRAQEVETTVYAIIFMAVSSLILYLIHRRLILKPVSTLSRAIKDVAAGNLTQRLDIHSEDEIGLLSDAFNTMTKELGTARERMENWTQTLEEEIAKKTEDLKKSQGKLIQAEKLAALGRLTSDVAHEIRNPLTSIGGFARRLQKIVSEPKVKEYSQTIATEVDRLEKILSDVLTFSRHARFHLERHAAEEIVWEAVKIHRDVCDEQSIEMRVEIEENLPPVLIDKSQAIQALSNLISNAVDAMRSGVLTIAAGKEELNDVVYVFVKVSDTGPGIPGDKLSLIFEPFFTTKEIGHGTGLGLSITRKIMEEHGGFIRAESEPGKGSVFSLYFPYQSEGESSKIPCWEFMKCGRNRDATEKCPAYPHFGRICWVVAGTFCEGKVQGTFAQKCEDCKKCEFHQKVMNKDV
ncbi:MAG: ATP-binding protein [bacterium]